MSVESAFPSMIVGGNVIGYSDHDENLYKERDVVGEFNRHAINLPGYGYNEILATVERFKRNHGYEFQPMSEYDLMSIGADAGFPQRIAINGSTQSPRSNVATVSSQMDADVAQAMSLLQDCILQA